MKTTLDYLGESRCADLAEPRGEVEDLEQTTNKSTQIDEPDTETRVIGDACVGGEGS